MIWTAIAIGFAAVLYGYCLWKFSLDPRLGGTPGALDGSLAWQVALEFLTGFLIEKSLAFDNIFVFVVIFQFFSIATKYQHRILFFGILGALLFRVIFIELGALLLQYKAIVIFFGVLLIATDVEIWFAPVKPIDPEANLVIRLLRTACSGHIAGRRHDSSAALRKIARDALAGRLLHSLSVSDSHSPWTRAGDLRLTDEPSDRIHVRTSSQSGNACAVLSPGRCGAEIRPLKYAIGSNSRESWA